MARTADMLRLVGFPDPARALRNYPFELSGGLRQRAMIAMALVCRPALLIADEPTTALDVTIQAQILALIKDLQAELGMAVLMITHDLGVVANLADEVVVLYRGRSWRAARSTTSYERPAHPYLRALLRAVPHFDMKPGERLVPVREIDHHAGRLLREDRSRWPTDAPRSHARGRAASARPSTSAGPGSCSAAARAPAFTRRRRRELRRSRAASASASSARAAAARPRCPR